MSSLPKYENVHSEDRDDLSITEVEESLMGDEGQMHRDELRKGYMAKSKKVTCLSILKEGRWFLDTALLLVIVVLLLRNQSEQSVPKTSEHEAGGDFTGVGPHCKHLPMDKQTHHIRLTSV